MIESCKSKDPKEEPNKNLTSEETSNVVSSDDNKSVTYDLTKFKLDRILNNNTRNKSIALLGRFPDISDTKKCIITFEKQAFVESNVSTDTQTEDQEQLIDPKLESSYFCADLQVRTEFINDVYGNFYCIPPPKMDGFKATVVYPATEKHINKYSISLKYVIRETPTLYNDVTLPYINSSQFSLEWVYNILEHKQEAERIIYEDADPQTGFILVPDLKWDGCTIETLYVLAIIHRRDIKSLRDLDGSHLPLLHNIRLRCAEVIEKKYGLLSTQLRMYFHYQPSFYHLHIHINPLRNEVPGIWCEKSHTLDTVINNLELMGDYYKLATLPFILYEGHKLLDLYEEKVQVRYAPKRLPQLDSPKELGKKKRKVDDGTNDAEVLNK